MARVLVPALENAAPTTVPYVRTALITIAGRDYGREVADWIVWAKRLP